jgi:hypothetical protein
MTKAIGAKSKEQGAKSGKLKNQRGGLKRLQSSALVG